MNHPEHWIEALARARANRLTLNGSTWQTLPAEKQDLLRRVAAADLDVIAPLIVTDAANTALSVLSDRFDQQGWTAAAATARDLMRT